MSQSISEETHHLRKEKWWQGCEVTAWFLYSTAKHFIYLCKKYKSYMRRCNFYKVIPRLHIIVSYQLRFLLKQIFCPLCPSWNLLRWTSTTKYRNVCVFWKAFRILLKKWKIFKGIQNNLGSSWAFAPEMSKTSSLFTRSFQPWHFFVFHFSQE